MGLLYRCQHALHLGKGEHTAEERIAGIVAAGFVAEHRLTVVDAHGQSGIGALEDAAKLHKVGTSAKVAGFGEVAIGEDVARAQMDEMGARGILAG